MPTLLALAVSLTSAGAPAPAGGRPAVGTDDWRVWAGSLSNDAVTTEVVGRGILAGTVLALPEPGVTWGDLRRLPPPEAAELSARLARMLADPDRYLAAHLVLWELHAQAPEPPAAGVLTQFGLYKVRYDYLDLPDGDVRAIPRVPDADRQRADLRRWWNEYWAGERTIFFEPTRGRPRPPRGMTDDQVVAYIFTMPPRPPDFTAMTPRELEAYYGPPPLLPEGFDADDVPDHEWHLVRPPPVPDWRARAGLPPAGAGG